MTNAYSLIPPEMTEEKKIENFIENLTDSQKDFLKNTKDTLLLDLASSPMETEENINRFCRIQGKLEILFLITESDDNE
ncbi:MAG: hypothetical protein KAH25_07535 [Bacteroidales bacterium]|nr:hypothetical protein [Bacteroidales bacterium]